MWDNLPALFEEQRPHVTNLLTQDIEFGFAFPIPVECLKDIPGAEVYPIDWQDQLTINERGKISPKKCMTHDPSYNRMEDLSVN